MALQVWLPLNGNLKNNGLSSESVVASTNTTVNSDGKIGSCYSFNGSNSNITVTNAIPSLEFSFGGWYKFNSISANACFATCRKVTGNGIALFELNNGKIRFDVSTNGTETGVLLTTNKWMHVFATYDGKVKKIYLDGELVQSEDRVLTSISDISTKGWSIGASQQGDVLYGGNNYLNGYVNDFRVYDHCLSQKEIKEVYNTLLVHFKLDEAYVGSMYDMTVYTEPDGSQWKRIAHHNNPAVNGRFDSADTFTTRVYKDANRWFDAYDTINKMNSYEFMIKQVPSGTTTEQKYRWVQTVNPITATYNDVKNDSRNIGKYNGGGYVTCGNSGGMWKRNANTHFCITDTSSTDWYGAIGSWNVFNGGVPAINYSSPSTTIYNGYIDLYARIDGSVPLTTKYDNNIYVEADGSKWRRIVYHNNPQANGFFSQTDDFVNGVYHNENVWFDAYDTINSMGRYEFMARQQSVSGGTIVKMRWVQEENPITTSYDKCKPATTSAYSYDNSDGYTVPANGGLLRAAGSTHFRMANANSGNTFGAFGCWTPWTNNTVPGFNSAGVPEGISTGFFELYARIDDASIDKNIYFEPDGSKWKRLSHHANPVAASASTTLFSSSDKFGLGVYKDANRWFDVYPTVHKMKTYEFMIKQVRVSGATQEKYRWVQAVSPIGATYDQVKPGTTTGVTTAGYSNPTGGGIYVARISTQIVTTNTSSGNWFGAIGAWAGHGGGIPGYPNGVVSGTSSYLDLYARIDGIEEPFWGLSGETLTDGVQDCSGYGNNGIPCGSISADTDTARYTKSGYVPDGGVGRIIYPAQKAQQFTYSFWFKRNSTTITGGNPPREMLATAWYGTSFELNQDNTLTFRHQLTSGIFDVVSPAIISSTTKWYHCVGTRDASGVSKLYIDGDLVASGTNTNQMGYTAVSGAVFCYDSSAVGPTPSITGNTDYQFHGRMSDFRIYATALSADDVKDLYNVGAYIINNGTFCAYEFDEDNGKEITKTGLAKNPLVQESAAGTGNASVIPYSTNIVEYTPTANADNSCAYVAKVEFADVSAAKTYVCEMDVWWYGGFAAGTGGTFGMNWQGTVRPVGGSYVWETGTNVITSALNGKVYPISLVKGSTAGSYHYKVEFTVPASSYDGYSIGVRTNYSSGAGTLRFGNVKVYEKGLSLDPEKARIGDSSIVAERFNEI